MPAQLEELRVAFRDDVTRGAEAAAAALNKMGAAGDGAKVAVEETDQVVRRAGQSAEQLARKYIDAERATAAKTAAEQRHSRALEDVARQEQAGTVTAERAAQLRSQIARQLEVDTARITQAGQRRAEAEARLLGGNNGRVSADAMNTIAGANDNAGRSFSRLTTVMGQAGFQIQDFAVQVQGGQSALTALSQQGSQLLGVFGTGGAVAGAVLTVGILVSQLIRGQDAQQQFNDALKAADEIYRAATEAASNYQRSLDDEANRIISLRGYYATLNAERRQFELARIQAARTPLEQARDAVVREAVGVVSQPGVGAPAVALRQLLDASTEAARRGQAFQPTAQQREVSSIGFELRGLVETGGATSDALLSIQGRLREAGQLRTALGEAARDTAEALSPVIDRLTQAEAALARNGQQMALLTGQALPTLQQGLGGAGTALERASASAAALAERLTRLRTIAAANPALGIQQEAVGIQQRLDALRRGGIDGLEEEQRRQENNQRVTEAVNRTYEAQLARLLELRVERGEAERQAREAAALAGQETLRRNELGDALERETTRRREAERATRSQMEAYGTLRTNQNGLLSLGGADDRAMTEAQRVIRGTPLDAAARQRADGEAQRQQDRAQREWEKTTDSIVNYGADRFADLWTSTGNGWSRLWASMLQTARQVLARIAAEAIIRPIIAPIVAGVLGSSGDAGGAAGSAGGGLASALGLAGMGSSVARLLGVTPSSFGLGSGGLSGALSTPLYSSGAYTAGESAFLSAAGVANPGMVTAGQLLGGAGLGFGAGMLATSLIANSPSRRTNGMIGSAGGAIAGAAIGSLLGPGGAMIGGLIGGGGGGALGSLIGPGKGFSGGEAWLTVDGSGRLGVTRTTGKRFDTAALANDVGGRATQINQQLDRLGLSFAPNSGAIALVGGGQSSFTSNIVEAVNRSGISSTVRANDGRVQGAIDRTGGNDLARILSVAQDAQGLIKALNALGDSMSDFDKQVQAVNDQFGPAIDKARELGFGEAELTRARDKALDGLRDPARQNAAGVVSDLADYTRGLRVANDNSGNPMSRLAAAQAQFSGDVRGFNGGDFRSFQRLRGSAESYRQLAREVYGTGTQYAGIEADIARLLEQIGNTTEDALTSSAMQAITETQTQTLAAALDRLRGEVSAWRTEVRQGGANPLDARAA